MCLALEGKRKEVTTSQQQLLLAQQQVMVIQQKCSQLEGVRYDQYTFSYPVMLPTIVR